MNTLHRITTEYVDREDRIRLTGEDAKAIVHVIWLSRRLLDRLVPHLTLWLEQQGGQMPRAELLMSFAQQAAQARLVPQPAVQAAAETGSWLTHEVDIRPGGDQMLLTFKSAESRSASIEFNTNALRQWLGIVQQAYAAGQWTLEAWPGWITENNPNHAASSSTPLVWH